MSEAKVLKCKCQNAYQDQHYGPGMRVHTPLKVTEKIRPRFRCTVCATEREARAD